jgi:hypothetical protein
MPLDQGGEYKKEDLATRASRPDASLTRLMFVAVEV